MSLKNTQTTVAYNPKQTTKKQREKVAAAEYDDTQMTVKNRTKVTATVEGSQ